MCKCHNLTILSDSEAIEASHSFVPCFCPFNCACFAFSISALRAAGSSLPICISEEKKIRKSQYLKVLVEVLCFPVYVLEVR